MYGDTISWMWWNTNIQRSNSHRNSMNLICMTQIWKEWWLVSTFQFKWRKESRTLLFIPLITGKTPLLILYTYWWWWELYHINHYSLRGTVDEQYQFLSLDCPYTGTLWRYVFIMTNFTDMIHFVLYDMLCNYPMGTWLSYWCPYSSSPCR